MKKYCVWLLSVLMVLASVLPVGAIAQSAEANDVTIQNFETKTGFGAIFSANVEWIAGGYGNSDGAVKITQGSNNLGGVGVESLHTKVGTTYEISALVKPPADNPTAIDGAHVILYHYYETDDGGVSANPGAFNELTLPDKTDMGNGWYKLSTQFTVSETVNLWTGTMFKKKKVGTAGTFEFRAQTTGVTYLVDDIMCVPVGMTQAGESKETNYLLHEDFEEGQGEIVMGDGTTKLTVQKSGGVDNSGYLSCVSTNDYGGIKKNNLTIEPNRVYKLSWWAKADNDVALNQYLTGYFMFSGFGNTPGTIQVRANGKIIPRDSTGEYARLTNEWKYYEAYYKLANLPYVAGESITGYFCTRIFPALTGNHGGVGANFSMDNIKIEKMPVPFNGDFVKTSSMQAEWNSPVTYYPVWYTGANTTMTDKTGDNPYITVTQTANSAGAEDTKTRFFGQFIPRKANTTYQLFYRAKSDSGISLTPVYSSFNSASAEVKQNLETVTLSSDWKTYTTTFTTDNTVSNAILGFSAEKGANLSSVSYDIDDITLIEQAPIIDAVPMTGEVKAGGSITAGAIPRIAGTEVIYRVLCASDGVNYAERKHGILNGNTVTYPLIDNDAGRYIKMEFIGVKNGTFTNKVTTEPVFFGGSFLYFTSGIYDKEYAAQGRILDANLDNCGVSIMIAMYGSGNELLDVHVNSKNVSELTNGKIDVSGEKAYGTVKAKAFLWKNDGSYAPITEPKEITQMERNHSVAVNIAADGIQTNVVADTTKSEAEYKELAENYVSAYLKDAPVGKMLYNVCYKRAITDSDVVDSVLYNVELNEDGTPKKDENGEVIKTVSPAATETTMLNNFRTMQERGIDVVEMLVDSTKDYGAEAWLSVRMNDHHFPNDIGFNSSLSYHRASEVGVNGSRTYMDHTNKVVQNYYKGYIKELCENYDIDGIELDYLRSAPVMSSVNSTNTAKLSQYVREIRDTVNEVAKKKGKTIKVSARVYSTPDHNLSSGIDPAQWIADGSIDMLVAEGWYIPTYYNIPIEEWRTTIDAKNTDNHPYSILGGTDWAVRCDSNAKTGYMMWITLEQFKGFASAMYERGADGVYFFNHFPLNGNGALTYYVDENGVKTMKNVQTDKLLAATSQNAAETGMRAYVNTCRDYSNTLYPITISDNSGYTVDMNTGSKPTKGYYNVIVGIDANEGYTENLLSVTVNGVKAKQIGDVPKANGFTWAPSASSEPAAQHVSETAPRVMQFVVEDLSVVKDGFNTITITNTATGKPQSVKWLEIQVDNTSGAKPLEMK